ncbi:hypothetical protein A9Q73_04590 [Bermanella sp. 47_1433_sub80_T6]|nr:hypothetical protein A9Q73_04590 [Bermanella sp. 47_1433_sub80_T6]
MCNELSSETFSCATMLQDITGVAQQAVGTVKTSLVQLDTDIASYCTVLDAASLKTAQDQWATTMVAVQKMEVMQFDAIDTARDNFYNWPSNDTCKVDLQIASGPIDDFTKVATGRRGLNSVEYILFEEDTLASCSTLYSSVTDWMALNDLAARKKARCDYAKIVTADLVNRATALETALSTLDLATKFESLQLAANSISDALFYVDKQTKDAKLKAALPQASDGEFKETSLESQFAHISKDHLKNNLLGARAIFTANDQTGFEDYLIAAGQESIATDMLAALDAALANLEAIEGDLFTAVENADNVSTCINTTDYVSDDDDIVKICALQLSVKTFTDLLKEDFVMVLKFTKPAAADGDND